MPSDNSFIQNNNSLPTKEAKEKMLQQRAKTIWFTGLSGAGKSTIGLGLEKKLFEAGFLTQVLDGDIIRSGINNNLGFSDADRFENIRRIAEVTKLFINAGVITINCFISPRANIRKIAKDIIGHENFIEVFVDTPIEICEKRDVKGLYHRARQGDITDFTGISAPYEKPAHPDLVITTHNKTPEESVGEAYKFVVNQLRF